MLNDVLLIHNYQFQIAAEKSFTVKYAQGNNFLTHLVPAEDTRRKFIIPNNHNTYKKIIRLLDMINSVILPLVRNEQIKN